MEALKADFINKMTLSADHMWQSAYALSDQVRLTLVFISIYHLVWGRGKALTFMAMWSCMQQELLSNLAAVFEELQGLFLDPVETWNIVEIWEKFTLNSKSQSPLSSSSSPSYELLWDCLVFLVAPAFSWINKMSRESRNTPIFWTVMGDLFCSFTKYLLSTY